MGETTAYGYTEAGKLREKWDANQQTTTYTYNETTGQLMQISYADGKTVTFTYDRAGNLSGYDDGTTSAIYTYDALGRKLTETVNYGVFSKGFRYTYYANGQKQTFMMPSGVTYSYTYHDNNELKNIRIPGVGNIEYPSYTVGRPDRVIFPGGNQQTYTYDALLRLEQITASSLDYGYTHDNLSNILTKSTEHGEYNYVYDDVSWLTNVANPTQPNEAYLYDGVGNRLPSLVTSPIVHNENNELLVYAEMTYEYDANGNLIQKRVGTVAVNYVYNAENRLVKVEDDLTKITIAEYYYDPFGRRLWKDVGGIRTYFFYADEGLVAEYDATGAEIRSYGYESDSTWTTAPLWLRQSGVYYWYQNDHLGTPQKLVAQNGAVVWAAQYSAFGKADIQTETVTNNLRFPGQYYDVETGLHYNYFRDYDPSIGRYAQADPIGFAGGDVNWYAYVWNNTVNWSDINGLKIICGSRNQTILEEMIEELRNNPVTHDIIVHLDDVEQHVIHIEDIDFAIGQPIPHVVIPGKSFSGATVYLNIQESPVFIQKLCPHIAAAASPCSSCEPPDKTLEEILGLVALAHELTHAYDASVDMNAHRYRPRSEQEARADRIEAQVAHSYGILARGDVMPFPYWNNSGMDYPYDKCYYYEDQYHESYWK